MLSFETTPFTGPHNDHGLDDIVVDCHSYEDVRPPQTPTHSPRPQPPTTITPASSSSSSTSSSWLTEPCLLPAEMRMEQARLQTFHTWSDTCVARKLSRYGFYVGPEGDCIRCAFCGLEVCGFSSARNVKLWHWQVSGKDCPLLTSGAVGHTPHRRRRDVEETVVKAVIGGHSRERVVSAAIQTHPQPSPGCEPRVQISKSTTSTTTSPGEVLESQRQTQISEVKDCRKNGARSSWFSPSSTSQSTTPTTSLLRGSTTSQQHLRPRSSPSSSPSSASCSQAPESRAGGSPGQTGSVSCGSDRAGYTPARSTPSNSTQAHPTPSAAPASGPPVWADIVRTARIPPMVPYQARLQTFVNWPLLSPTPRNLARAGFYRDTTTTTTKPSPLPSPSSSSPVSPPAVLPSSSPPRSTRTANSTPSDSVLLQSCAEACGEDSGSRSRGSPSSPSRSSGGGAPESRGDSVRCFWCGERVHRWQRSDDPALEHARLSPGCSYVIQLLGRQLHRDVITASTSPSASVVGR